MFGIDALKTAATRGFAVAALVSMSAVAAAGSTISVGGYSADDTVDIIDVYASANTNGSAVAFLLVGNDASKPLTIGSLSSPIPGTPGLTTMNYTSGTYSTVSFSTATNTSLIPGMSTLYDILFITADSTYDAIIARISVPLGIAADYDADTPVTLLSATLDEQEPPVVPLPAGGLLLLGGLGVLAATRRKKS